MPCSWISSNQEYNQKVRRGKKKRWEGQVVTEGKLLYLLSTENFMKSRWFILITIGWTQRGIIENHQINCICNYKIYFPDLLYTEANLHIHPSFLFVLLWIFIIFSMSLLGYMSFFLISRTLNFRNMKTLGIMWISDHFPQFGLILFSLCGKLTRILLWPQCFICYLKKLCSWDTWVA